MAIDTYSALKSAVADFMNRSDMTTAQQETFIQLAEADIRNDVRVRAMEQQTAVTISSITMPAPSLLLEARELSVEDFVYEYVSPQEFTAHQRAQSVERVFTQRGSNFLVNNIGSTAVATLTYTEALSSLTAATNTNYVLTYAPDVYLYGACAHAAQYYQDAGNLERYKALYLGAVTRLNAREAKARVSGGPMAIYAANTE